MKQFHKAKETLKKFTTVNKKAFDQYNDFTRQRDELTTRREELDHSADSITELIEVLDQRKDEAIERTFKQVSRNFEEVFSKLVPTGRGRLIIQSRINQSGEEEEQEVEDDLEQEGDEGEGASDSEDDDDDDDDEQEDDQSESENEGQEGESERASKRQKKSKQDKNNAKGTKNKSSKKGQSAQARKTKHSTTTTTKSKSKGQKQVTPARKKLTTSSAIDNYTGVTIKVSFNSKSDEGLRIRQLSGGQKSLVALAMIFAIQKCDPAPFYLFDEIDANLDADRRTAVAGMLLISRLPCLIIHILTFIRIFCYSGFSHDRRTLRACTVHHHYLPPRVGRECRSILWCHLRQPQDQQHQEHHPGGCV